MRMKRFFKLFIAIVPMWWALALAAQNELPVQTIRGVIADAASGVPLAFVHVSLLDRPGDGAVTQEDGTFAIENVPVGRHELCASFVSYESEIVREILLTSAREVYLEIHLREKTRTLGEVVVKPRVSKEEALNKMALTGARMFSVEEAGRFAGGMDDPARLASSFAGVASAVGNNGIAIHGNAPGLLQWRLEGVEIPNPNHFADVASLGGGILSALSSQVLGNSDFYTGAFPSEYGNALSGVFDMKLRNGNNRKFQHTLQAGLLGLDVASEGPLSKKHTGSFLFNYRYSATGLMNKISPAGALEQVMDYQDLNFKLTYPTRKAGVFSVWNATWIDRIKPEIDSSDTWEYIDDAKDSRMRQTSAAAGITHTYFMEKGGLLKTVLATTYSRTHAWESIYDQAMKASSCLDFESRYTHWILTSSWDKKYSSKHTNKTGCTLTFIKYAMDFSLAPFYTRPVEQVAKGKGSTQLLSAYTSSLFHFNDNLSATLGVHGQLLTLNGSRTLEPRASLRWQFSPCASLGLAYGLHSRMEKMDVYFVQTAETGKEAGNKKMGFTKTHHLSLAYSYKISEAMHLKIEPYFQYLFDVPVIADSSYSVLNRATFYVKDILTNKGKGRNYGVDITFEKYLTQGWYALFTASVFNSEYSGGDGVWHSTKYNRNYILNGLIGKEWMTGRRKRDVLSVNLKLTLQGGDRYAPVDEQATLAHPDKETQYDETKAYSQQLAPICLAHYTVSYRMNRKKVSHELAVKGMNATGYKEYFGHAYNLKTGKIEPRCLKNSIFNLVYRLDF